MEDPPAHDIHRSLLARVFTPRRVLSLEPQIRDFCTRSLDRLAGVDCTTKGTTTRTKGQVNGKTRRKGRFSSPAPPAARAAATQSGWRKRAPTSSQSTSVPAAGVGRYPMATPEELDQTVKAVEALGRHIVAPRPTCATSAALRQRSTRPAELGPVDIVLANAGIGRGRCLSGGQQEWEEVVDVNLTGRVEHRPRSDPVDDRAWPGRVDRADQLHGRPEGSASPRPASSATPPPSTASIGLMRSWANYLAPHNIRVNSVAPTAVRTPMADDGNLAAIMNRSGARARACPTRCRSTWWNR